MSVLQKATFIICLFSFTIGRAVWENSHVEREWKPLLDEEEVVTDLTRLFWEKPWLNLQGEVDVDKSFDGNPETFTTVNVEIHGKEPVMVAEFYSEVELKGVRIVLEDITKLDSVEIAVVNYDALRHEDHVTWEPDHVTQEPDHVTQPVEEAVQLAKCTQHSSTWNDGRRTTEFDCHESFTEKLVIALGFQAGGSVKVVDIKMFGNEKASNFHDGEEMFSGGWSSYSSQPLGATATPFPWNDEYESLFEDGNNNSFDLNDGEATWAPYFQQAVPYRAFNARQENAVERSEKDGSGMTLMGYLSEAGYLEFVVTEDKVEEQEEKEEAKAAKKKEKANSKEVGEKKNKAKKEKVTVDKNDISESIQIFQKLNGFPETGTASREMLEYVKEPRCGNSDLEFTVEQVEREAKLCDILFAKKKPTKESINFECEAGLRGAKASSKCGLLPLPSRASFSESSVDYKIDIDIQYKPGTSGTWEDLENNFSIFFNYDGTRGDEVKLFATADKIGFKHGNTRLENNSFKMSATQASRRSFKIRIDVEEGGTAYLLISGQDAGKIQYTNPLKPSVLLQWVPEIPEIITARLCKSDKGVQAVSRRKRSSSTHLWGTNRITFSFQNYSTLLGEEKVREGVFKALELLGDSTKLKFVERPAHEITMVTYMFIRGKHADGATFHGAGAEKAHAYSPVNSEIHFNDYQAFTLDKEKDRSTGMFYMALHETGHALGLRHSDYRDALMAVGYDHEKAFSFKELHRDDRKKLTEMYPEPKVDSGVVNKVVAAAGSVKQLAVSDRASLKVDYQPKLPLPRECFSSIDAAFTLGTILHLISNTFVWRYKMPETQRIGSPQRLSDVLGGWNFVARAAFSVDKTLYVLSDTVAYRYQQYGSVLVLDKRSTPDKLLNTKKSNYKFPTVRAAFTLKEGGSFVTTLVTGSKEYYKITWKTTKKIETVEKIEDAKGTNLLGKTYGDREFNAAEPYEREKDGVKSVELLKFDRKYVKSVKVFPVPGEEPRKTDPFQTIAKAFTIAKWCASKVA